MKKPISIISNSNNNSELFVVSKRTAAQDSQSNWTASEDAILMESLAKLKIRNKWKSIAKLLNKTVQDCILRFKTINPLFKRGHWTPEEDKQLNALVEVYGKNWARISQIMKQRTGKQIRQRYLNFLDPNVNKEKFSINEDIKIFKLYKFLKTNWRYYTKYIQNRTADMIKGRFYSSIRFKENLLKLVNGLDEDYTAEALRPNANEGNLFPAEESGLPSCMGELRFNNELNFNDKNNNNKINFYLDNNYNNNIHKENSKEECNKSLRFSEKRKTEMPVSEYSKFQSCYADNNINNATVCCNSQDCFSICNSSDVEINLYNYKNTQSNSKILSNKYNHSKFSTNFNENSKTNSIIFTDLKGLYNEETLTDYENYSQEPKFSLSFEDEDIFATERNFSNVSYSRF